ncbi:MAG: hypothetical protein K9N29_11545 [Candidatus Marinimicrobia bacterium]|nr:hypothetical protein [Candidatus Neomarinimicrobiota bacterium]
MTKKMTTLINAMLFLTLLVPQLQAWYPDYSVLATEFPVRNDFLRPLQLHSAALQGMGEYFNYIYKVQPDFRFIDPTYPLGQGQQHIFYLDLGAEKVWNDQAGSSSVSPVYYDINSAYTSDYAFWSPYRELSHEQIPEPSFRIFYLSRLGESPGALTLGGSYSLSYDETQFYQPYSFDYFRSYDAMGAAYENSAAYDDYRLRESGEDESISTEHQVNFFLSKAISSRLTLGARLGLVQADVDGNYGNYQFYDQSEWADDYESYSDSDVKRLQSQDMSDINLGLAYTTTQHQRFALNGGIISGRLERSFNNSDTSRYYSITLNPDDNISTTDSNIYRSTSYYVDDKKWQYDGNGYYVRLLAELPENENLMFRFGGSAEWRSADLTESENMLRRSNYFNQYYAEWDNVWRRYSSRSMVDLEREGSGSYSSELYQISGGVEWQLQPELNFYGGLYLEHYDRLQEAREPFAGTKHALTSTNGYNYDYEELEALQNDLKTFVWEQHQWRTTLAAPLGLEYQILPAIGLQLGLTKVFQRSRITEGYDVIVEEYHYTEIEDGVTTRDDLDTDYVDGYVYPEIKDFDDRFDFNAGLNIRSGDKLRVSVVLTNAFRDEYAVKIGGSISW